MPSSVVREASGFLAREVIAQPDANSAVRKWPLLESAVAMVALQNKSGRSSSGH
jgi:hypothetical protein